MISITIRGSKVEDAEEMVRVMDLDALQNFQFFVDKRRLPTVEEQAAYLAKTIDSKHDRLWTILANGKIIGTIGLHEIDRNNKNARLGVMLFSKDFRGKGWGSSAMRQVLQIGLAKAEMNLHKIYLVVFAENTASAAKYAHLGFQFEARIQDHYRLKDTYYDMVQMRLFQDEWESRI